MQLKKANKAVSASLYLLEKYQQLECWLDATSVPNNGNSEVY
jgi:hypothetical protein